MENRVTKIIDVEDDRVTRVVEEEVNYNRYKPKANNEEEMRRTMKLFQDELLELIETYLKPWIK